jgi:basic amino acid/polyamine antiporter, APA family
MTGTSASPTSQTELRRELSTFDLLSVGISGIIGAGIFVLTGSASALYAGPAVVLSFLISGTGAGFSALCYSELSSILPVSGSAYAFTSATLGDIPAWFIGWDMILEYCFGAAAVAVGWSGYCASILADWGAVLPKSITTSFLKYDAHSGNWTLTGGGINVPAVLIVVACTWLNIRGIREAATVGKIIVVIKVTVLIIFICAGASFVNTDNWHPFIPPSETMGIYGFSGVLRGSAVVFMAYLGFDAISCVSQEAKDPQRSIPIATLGSLVICTVLYIGVSLVLTGLVPYHLLDVADPIALAVNAAGPGLVWLRPIVKLGAILGLTSVILVLIMGQARILFAMADDGLLPPLLKRVHPKYQTPHVSTITTGIIAGTIAGLFPIDILGEMVSIGTLSAFVLVCAGVIVLRRTKPDLHRPFRTPWSPYIPIAGILSSILMMVSLPWSTWVRLLVWMALGSAVYYWYGRHNVKPYHQKRAVILAGLVPSPSADRLATEDDSPPISGCNTNDDDAVLLNGKVSIGVFRVTNSLNELHSGIMNTDQASSDNSDNDDEGIGLTSIIPGSIDMSPLVMMTK